MREHGVGILGLGGYVPARVMTNDDWAAYVDTSDEWITSRTGIKERRVAAADETTVDLAAAAARVALADARLEVAEIDEIVVASDTPEVFTPDTAAYLQHELRARHVPAYDLAGSGCAGFVLALDVALARAQRDGRRVLVVGVELITRLIDWYDRETCVLFGDGAGAAVVGPGQDPARILAATSGTDGSRSDILGIEAGGTRVPITVDRARDGLHQKLVMKGREVFKEAVRHMSRAALDVLREAGLSIEDVNLVVPHQANLRIIDAVRDRLGVAPERVFVNVESFGNTGSASVPLALWQARDAGRIRRGDVVLLTAFGAGFHWAAAVIQF